MRKPDTKNQTGIPLNGRHLDKIQYIVQYKNIIGKGLKSRKNNVSQKDKVFEEI